MAMMKKKERATSEVPTSSMADIAFLLLVFFLVTTVFDEEKGLQMVLPEAENEVEISPSNILFFQIQPTGVVHIKRGESPQIQTATSAQVGGIWRQEFAANDKLVAAVMTAPNAQYRHMIDVLDQLQAVGAERVSLQVLEN